MIQPTIYTVEDIASTNSLDGATRLFRQHGLKVGHSPDFRDKLRIVVQALARSAAVEEHRRLQVAEANK